METILIEFFENKGIEIYGQIPNDAPERFIIIELLHRYIDNHIYHDSIALLCYAPTLYEAAAFCEEVQQLMEELNDNDVIASVKCVRSYHFPDTRTKHHRYQSIYRFTYYK